MNLSNATLVSITAAGTVSTGGDTAAGATTTLNKPCICSTVTTRQVITLAEKIKDASVQIRVLKSDLPAGVIPAARQIWSVKVDGDSFAQSYELIFVDNNQKSGGLEHFKCFGKVMS